MPLNGCATSLAAGSSRQETLTIEASWMSRQMTLPGIDNATSLPESEDGRTHCDLLDGQMTGKCGPDHAHVSHSASQENAPELLTSGTCGRSGSGSYASKCLSLSLASRYRARTRCLGSTMFRLTSSEKVTPSGRWIPVDRALALHTYGKDCTSWPRAVPTPSANDWKGASRPGQRRGQIPDPAMGLLPNGGVPSPSWVAWIMGLPAEWDACAPTATRSSRKSRQKS